MDVEEFLGHYNRITAEWAGVPRSGRTAESEARAFLRAADDLGIDPVAVVGFRHRVPCVGRVPITKLLNKPEVARFKAHEAMWVNRAYQLIGDERLSEAVEVEPTEGITTYTERLKATMAAKRVLCLQSRDTRGWHPASEHCRSCDLAQACKGHLHPAVLARRNTHARS